MAQAIAFDTLAYSKKLIAAGVPVKQAEVQSEALAEIIEDRISTKQDIEEVKREIKELEVTLKRDMKEMEVTLKRDMIDLEQRIIIKLGAMMAASIAIVAALVELLK